MGEYIPFSCPHGKPILQLRAGSFVDILMPPFGTQIIIYIYIYIVVIQYNSDACIYIYDNIIVHVILCIYIHTCNICIYIYICTLYNTYIITSRNRTVPGCWNHDRLLFQLYPLGIPPCWPKVRSARRAKLRAPTWLFLSVGSPGQPGGSQWWQHTGLNRLWYGYEMGLCCWV